jgi:hypothetical protein
MMEEMVVLGAAAAELILKSERRFAMDVKGWLYTM